MLRPTHGNQCCKLQHTAPDCTGSAAAAHSCMRRTALLAFDPLRRSSRQLGGLVRRRAAADAERSFDFDTDSTALPENFCIIESRDTVKDFATMQLDEISGNIAARRNKIFLLMEEVRRLRIQQKLKGGDDDSGAVSLAPPSDPEPESYLSVLPFLPPLTDKTLSSYYTFYACFVAAVISFGALLAPLLEVKMGVGGTSYLDFVQSLHLPAQLAEVDPIVASFCGGAVGVVSALLVVELNNVEKQQRNRCHYCQGSGYLPCGHCVGSGIDPTSRRACSYCAGTSKVMCTGCLCTGKTLVTEYDRRIDPFE